MAKKILLAGESWMSFTTHVKGFDTFYTSVYETGHQFLQAAMEANLGADMIVVRPEFAGDTNVPKAMKKATGNSRRFLFPVYTSPFMRSSLPLMTSVQTSFFTAI